MSASRQLEPATPVAVDVTFLRMVAKPTDAVPALPDGVVVARVRHCTVPFYRFLYDTVGATYCWWLRRTVPDREVAAILADPRVSIHVLYKDNQPAGFYELERRGGMVNLSYFGLLPHMVGTGCGRAFLRNAIDRAWSEASTAITVNTCTADHPRALPNYLAAGFVPVQTVREVWRVPNSLGLVIPDRLKV